MARTARTIAGTLALAAALAAGAATAEAKPRKPPPHDLQLAQQFRPRLLFDSGERWRPLDVDRFLAEPGHAICPPGGAPCTPLADAAQLTPAVDHLDLRGDGPADAGDEPRAIYAHVVRGRTRVAIDYWWFLRYNAFSFDRHEGDWEGVTVIADRRGERVLAVHFAAHGDVWRYGAGVPIVKGRRVTVYVANGSHASYPRGCARRCRQTNGTLPERRFDGARSWTCRRRCVKLLPTSAWNAWEGRWGVSDSPAFPAPPTPSLQRRFKHPFAAQGSARDVF